MDPVQVRPHPAVCVKPLVPVIRFFFPRMLDFGGRQVHRQVDARAEHGRRPTEFALPNRTQRVPSEESWRSAVPASPQPSLFINSSSYLVKLVDSAGPWQPQKKG